VTFGVSGLGHLTFKTREAWVLGLHFFLPLPVDPRPYLIGQAAKLTALNSALVIPPETADALFKKPKIFSEVRFGDIRAGDIIAFYTTADAGKLYPAGALLHSMPVRSYRPLAPAPRPAGSAVTPP